MMLSFDLASPRRSLLVWFSAMQIQIKYSDMLGVCNSSEMHFRYSACRIELAIRDAVCVVVCLIVGLDGGK